MSSSQALGMCSQVHVQVHAYTQLQNSQKTCANQNGATALHGQIEITDTCILFNSQKNICRAYTTHVMHFKYMIRSNQLPTLYT